MFCDEIHDCATDNNGIGVLRHRARLSRGRDTKTNRNWQVRRFADLLNLGSKTRCNIIPDTGYSFTRYIIEETFGVFGDLLYPVRWSCRRNQTDVRQLMAERTALF